MSPSFWQILIVVLAIVLLFGAGRLPRLMGDLAEGIKSFKKGMKDEEADQHESDVQEKPKDEENKS
jgi:sec-independent protein translocase protein TatA